MEKICVQISGPSLVGTSLYRLPVLPLVGMLVKRSERSTEKIRITEVVCLENANQYGASVLCTGEPVTE